MTAVLLGILGTLIGPLSGLITTRLMDYIDDAKGWTDKLPDSVKQLIVMGLAAVIPLVNARFNTQLPADPSALVSQPSIQTIVAMLIAFILKGHKKVSAITTPAAAPVHA